MANLVELFDNIVQMQNLNGVPLAAGKLYVYALGRTRLMDSWSDVDGESLNPNPIILDDAGQAHVYVSDDFDYTLVVCDQYNNEIFSLDKYLYSKGSHSHADVAVAPSESIAVSSYHVGECTVYVPYLTGQLGKVYEGIDPIVVNNQVDKISANHVPLGVQDPLYFVQDDEEGCIIGLSGGTVPEGTMNESAFGYQDGQITSYNGSAFSAGNSYEAGSYVDIDGNTINVTGLQPAGNYQSAGDYVSASELENLQPKGDYYSASNPSGFITGVDLTDYAKTEDLTAYQPIGNYYSASNPSGFINSDAISAMATTSFVADVSGDITALIPTDLFTKESADTLYQPIGNYQTAGNYVSASELSAYATTSLVSSVSSTITGMIPTGDFELVAGTNIELVDDAVNHTTTINMTADIPSTAGLATTAQLSEVSADITGLIPTALTGEYVAGNNESGFAIASNSGSIAVGENEYLGSQAIGIVKSTSGIWLSPNQLEIYGNGVDEIINANDISALKQLSSNKLDTTAFSDVSGTFLTAHQDLSDYQTIAGMTAYQPAGDYLTTADSANFYTTANESGYLTAVPDTYLQNTDLTIASGKVTEISGIPLAAGATYTSPSGTILIRGNTLEASNSAVATAGYEGFVSSFGTKGIGPKDVPGGIVNFSWDKSLPTTEFNFVVYWPDLNNTTITYSANTNLTGEITPTTWSEQVNISVPNVTALDIWCTTWMGMEECVASAADSLETTVGELAWASALTAYQPAGNYLTAVPAGTMNESSFAYDTGNNITAYNGSAFAGGGGAGAGVSGTNVIFVPEYEGADYGRYYSATISGDVIVTTGRYYDNGAYIDPGRNYSLSAIGVDFGNKLDKNKIEDSNTIKIINDHAEVTNKAYRPVGFSDMSAYYVDVGNNSINVYFMPNDSHLYSAIVTVETTASGSYIPDGWSLVSYENNSAIFTKYYPLNKNSDNFSLYNINGWGEFTNCEASSTVYSALEIAPLAFKDDITSITYTTGSI